MGKRPGRPRGAPPGNKNRLKHGLYSAAHRTEHAQVAALIRESRYLVRRVLLFVKLRKVVQRLAARTAPSGPAGHLPRERGRTFERRTNSPPFTGEMSRNARRRGAAIRGSPRRLAAMTNRQWEAMPFARKLVAVRA